MKRLISSVFVAAILFSGLFSATPVFAEKPKGEMPAGTEPCTTKANGDAAKVLEAAITACKGDEGCIRKAKEDAGKVKI